MRIADQMRQDRCSRWRDALSSDAVVTPAKAPQNLHGGGRRNREKAMTSTYQSVAARKFRNAPGALRQSRRDASGSHDVHQRVPVGYFVEVYFLDRHTVHTAFRLGEAAQDGNRLVRRSGVKSGRRYQSGDFGETHRVIVMMAFVVMVVMVMVVRRLVVKCNQRESSGCNATADSFAQGGQPAVGRDRGSQVGENPGLQIRECIQDRGDKHVARHAAGGVQMDMIVFSHDFQERESRRGLPG